MSTKKKCNPIKRMFLDVFGMITHKEALAVYALIVFIVAQFSVFIYAMADYTTVKVLDDYSDCSLYHFVDIPTIVALWCRGMLLMEATIIIALLFFAWYDSASKRCK